MVGWSVGLVYSFLPCGSGGSRSNNRFLKHLETPFHRHHVAAAIIVSPHLTSPLDDDDDDDDEHRMALIAHPSSSSLPLSSTIQHPLFASSHRRVRHDTLDLTRLDSARLDSTRLVVFCSLLLLQSRSLSSFSSRVNWISGGRRRRRRTESISTFGFCSIRQDSIDQSMKHHHQLVAIDDLIWAPFIRIESALLLLFTEEEERKKEKNRSMENGFLFFFFFFIFSFCCCCCRVVRDERR